MLTLMTFVEQQTAMKFDHKRRVMARTSDMTVVIVPSVTSLLDFSSHNCRDRNHLAL